MSSIRVMFFILLLACVAASGYAAEKTGTFTPGKEGVGAAEQEKASEDPLGRSTPQGTVFGFTKSATQGDYERALQYLNTKKTLENLISGITIVSDHPIRVGDYCRAGDYQGTVLAIGLRSTRIQTLARTIVSIPNGQLATMNLENFSLRDKVWFRHTLNLRYETTTEQLRYILAEIRTMFYGHPKVESSSARVRFIGFGESSLDLEVFAYVFETDYAAFLPIQEDLLLRIMDIVAGSGSGFAFPSQTTYLAQDPGMDAGKTQEAIMKVLQWREKGELPFPDFSSETIAKINNQLEYPPPDSALGMKGKR